MNPSWRNMDRTTLDTAYNNGDPPTDFKTRSATFYAAHHGELDVKYGPAPRQRYDFFPASKGDRTNNGDRTHTPTFVFVHGGYWQSCDKELCAFVAEGPLGLGMNVVIAEYTLAPDASMTQIVGEIGLLLDFLAERGHSPLVLGGHSAGGHLTAMHRAHPAVRHALPVSGLFDLEPIGAGRLNIKLQLSEGETARFSPIRHITHGAPMVVSVGDAERPELIRHSHDYAQACVEAGERMVYVPLPAADHFSVLYDLAKPDGLQLTALAQLMQG
ncbi:esterase [Caballeronia mineralivorans PML1(12)]|uniref:Esterase n=1 Tax=Caballeronia mineralivorans PML1(12) TaxID=908627 RepID=A0A0J1CZ13_9BURK|nr:alpha/beta hydrolase [Caballeronia mineralivorans]KLU25797.1 esterase [Caballeronia mineralivorans PML1(12)]